MAWPATSTTTAALNLRQSPSMSASILTVMPKSGNIQITGEAQNGWYPVTYNGQTGWASAQYIKAPTPSSGTGTAPASPYGSSTTKAALNLRSTGSTSGSILAVMPKSAQVTITGPAVNGWYPVMYNGQTGYASAQYINSFTPSAPSPDSGGGTTSPAPPQPPPPHIQDPGTPFYNPDSNYGSSQDWYDTPLVKQSQDFDSEWTKSIAEQGYGGFNTKSNVARNLVDGAKRGFSAATMSNPNLDPRTYINESLGPNFLKSAMASMTPLQRGEMPGVYQNRARWNER